MYSFTEVYNFTDLTGMKAADDPEQVFVETSHQ